jgi:hypothetical protein
MMQNGLYFAKFSMFRETVNMQISVRIVSRNRLACKFRFVSFHFAKRCEISFRITSWKKRLLKIAFQNESTGKICPSQKIMCFLSSRHLTWKDSLQYVHVHGACTCPYCISMSTVHATVHGTCPCCKIMHFKLHMDHVHIRAACPYPRCMSMSMCM